MPKTFSEKERQIIIANLKRSAYDSMVQKGIKATTVDDLVKEVNIPKGTFYLFYKSKELLLYDVLMSKEEEFHKTMEVKLLKLMENFNVSAVSNLLFEFYQEGFKIVPFNIMKNGELDVLIRKLPDEAVSKSVHTDDEFLLLLKNLFPNMKEEAITYYSSAFRAIFFTAMYQREISNYPEALKLLINGLVLQMCGEKND